MLDKDETTDLLGRFERARRRVSQVSGVKGSAEEREYAILYDKLALHDIGNRRRLRKKYRN